MAKQHVFSRLKMWLGDNEIGIKNQYVRVRYHLEFGVTHTGYGTSNDYGATFDLQMLRSRMLELMKNSLAIVLQNKILRPMTPETASKWLKDHDPIKLEDLFPGKRSATPRVMTPEEMKSALLASMTKEELLAFINGDDTDAENE